MQISGSIPMHVARAYGVAPSPGPGPGSGPVAPTAPAGGARAIDARADEPASDRLRALIGGTVRGPVDFTTASPARSGAFQMYTRAADKIEAAVDVQLGRAIDVKG